MTEKKQDQAKAKEQSRAVELEEAQLDKAQGGIKDGLSHRTGGTTTGILDGLSH